MLTNAILVLALSAFPSAFAASTDPLKVVSLEAPDGSARANFIPYGATATNFFVRDKHGIFRDILLGFDNHTLYQSDAEGHPYFGPVVGRYANRIKNSSFTLDGVTYHIPSNENLDTVPDTLHGGLIGYDRRPWEIVHQSKNAVTFELHDLDGEQGFPGDVTTQVTYTLQSKATWKISMHATADQRTPIMLSGHHYWNLEGYKETQTLDDHYAEFQASKFIGTDGRLIPNGTLLSVKENPAMDFRKAKSIGKSIPATAAGQYCGTNCTGFDNCWIFDDNKGKQPAFSLWSTNSGIRLDVTTNQPAVQVYSCNGVANPTPIPRKKDQGGGFYDNHSCVVVEQESWIDAINNPEWKIDQIYGPKRDYHWDSSYAFSIQR